MKESLKKIFITFSVITVIFYIIFLVVLPGVINLNVYKEQLSTVVKESTGISLSFANAKLYTTPSLNIGVKIDNISAMTPKNEPVFRADELSVKLSPLPFLFKTIKITGGTLVNPEFQTEITTEGEYKILTLIDNKKETVPVSDSIPEYKVIVKNFTVKNYRATLTDEKSKKNIEATGSELKLSFDGNNALIKGDSVLSATGKKSIQIKADIDTYLPQSESDTVKNAESGKEFINPVLALNNALPTCNLQTKLKIREKNGTANINGYLRANNIGLNVDKIQLPPGDANIVFKGTNADINLKLYTSQSDKISLNGKINYGKHASLNLKVLTDELQFNDIVKAASAISSSFGFSNVFEDITASGTISADVTVNTDFKKLKSNGKIIIEKGNFLCRKSNLHLENLNSRLLFDNNKLQITDTGLLINGTPLRAEGTINESAVADIKIETKQLSIAELLTTFLPANLKKAYTVKSGIFSASAVLRGKIAEPNPDVNISLKNLNIYDKVNNITYKNTDTLIKLKTDLKTYNGNISNKGFSVNIPDTASSVKIPETVIDFNEKTVKINPSVLTINNSTAFNLSGTVENYVKSAEFNITGKGNIKASDIKKLAGKDIGSYLRASGTIPVNMQISGNDKKQNIIITAEANSSNHITPVDISSAVNKTSLLKIEGTHSGDRLTLKNSGLYTEGSKSPLISGEGVIILSGAPSFSSFKLSLPTESQLSLCAFKGSTLKAKGLISADGNITKPKLSGNVMISNLSVPDIYLTLKEGKINLSGNTFSADFDTTGLNGSYLNIKSSGLLNYSPIMTLTNLKIESDYINSDKVLNVTDRLATLSSGSGSEKVTTQPTDLPFKINTGTINIKKLSSGTIEATSIVSDISMLNNVFYLKNLKADVYDGNIKGDVSTNLITSSYRLKVNGSGLNADKTLIACAGMKNTLKGTMYFDADLTLRGTNYTEQIATLNGNSDFEIKNGQFGSFGKFENFLLADNISSQAFLATTVGSLINRVSPHNTADFSKLTGKLKFTNGTAEMLPIESTGKNMSLYITGKLNLSNNYGDMKILGRISKEISSLLGPLMQLNPVSMISSVAGLNYTTAAIFNVLSQIATPAELNKIPSLTPNAEQTTEFTVTVRGNVQNPAKAVKSFRWLNTQSEVTGAQNSLKSLIPDISTVTQNIPKTKEEAVSKLKEAGMNTLFNIGKTLLGPTETTTSEPSSEKPPSE